MGEMRLAAKNCMGRRARMGDRNAEWLSMARIGHCSKKTRKRLQRRYERRLDKWGKCAWQLRIGWDAKLEWGIFI